MKAGSHFTFCLHHCKTHKVTIVNKECLASYLQHFISVTARIQSAQLVPILHVNTFSISHVCGAMIYILKIFLKCGSELAWTWLFIVLFFRQGWLKTLSSWFSVRPHGHVLIHTQSFIHTGQLHLTVAWAPSKHVCPEVRPGFKPWPWAPSVSNFSLQLYSPRKKY